MNLPIHITEHDLRRIKSLIRAITEPSGSDGESLKRLTSELERASVVTADQLPADTITMNSTAELENLTNGHISTYTLVYPEMADIDEGRLSILAPLGMAMIGYRKGDEFEWPTPGGTVRIRVRRLLQGPPVEEQSGAA